MSDEELRALYQAVIKTSGHPDPVGYVARAMVFSELNPDYIDISGKMGFMPITPDRAAQTVGATEVQSLQGNVIATLAMDMMHFEQLENIQDMIVAFHEGIDAVSLPLSDEMKELIDALPELREQMLEILSPRLATVDDVIRVLTQKNSIPKKRLDAFKEILRAGK